MKRILSVILSFCIIFSSIGTVSALEIELPKSLEGFTAEVSEMINEYDETATADEPVFFTAGDEETNDDTYDTNRLIVKSSRKIDTLNSINYVSGYNDLYILQFENDEDCDKAMGYYSSLECVEYVQEDGILKETAIEEAEQTVNEAAIGISSQYQSDIFGYTNAKANMGSAPVTIAVVDTGVQNDHEYLSGRVIPTGFDSVYNESCYDTRGHGTHVAGIIVANTKSNVKIKPYKVIGDDGMGTDTQLYLGIQAAIEDGVDIINLSLTRKGESEIVHEAVINAYNAGITVVAAAGNDNVNLAETFYTPACFDEVICVVNIDANKKRSSTSNWRFNDTLSAPGVDILSSYVNNTYKVMSGTSMAAPFISCCVAYLLASGDYYSPDEAYNTLYANSKVGATASIHYVVPGQLITVNSTCATPVFTYHSGEFAGYLDVEITCDTPGATIMYKTSDMNSNTYYEYKGAIRIEEDETISAYAFCKNYKNSSAVTANYTKSGVDASSFVIDENDVLVGYTGNEATVEVPDFINGKSVTSVSATAFGGNTSIKSVTFTKYLTTIGASAFKDCTSLVSVYASGCTDIEAEAFSGCTSLKTASITSVVTIGDSAFYGCSALTKLSLSKLTTLGESAFANSGITTFSASKLVTIGDYAFKSTLIQGASFSNVTTIGTKAFENCNNLKSVSFSKIKLIGADCFVGCNNLTSASFNSLTVIPSNLFKNCTSLTSVSFQVATEVNEYAFYGCSALTNVQLPAIISVGDYAFYGCSGITSLDFTKVTTIGDYSFCNNGFDSIVLPNVVEIGEKAFDNCTAVKSIELASATEFDTISFTGLSNVESLNLPKVTEFAFNGGLFVTVFPNLKTFNNENGVEEIPDSFFEGCSQLESVIFRHYVYVIGDNAFKGTSLKEAKFETAHTFGESCFSDIPTLETVIFNAFGSDDDFSIFSGSENIKSIEMTNLTKLPEDFNCLELFPLIIRFNSHVRDVPDYAFKNCKDLSRFLFTYTETIGIEAFMGTAITNPDCGMLIEIGAGAFKDCKNLGIVKLPMLKYIDLSVFENSESSVTELNLKGLTNITEEDAESFNFSKFISLKSVNLSSINVIPAKAFKDCPALTDVSLGQCTKICEEAFAYCTSLESVKINNVTAIEKNAFKNCASLQSFEANSVTEFDFTTFDGCSNLKSLSFNALTQVPVDDNGKFNIKGLDNLESFSANKLKIIPDNFFKDCTKLTTVSFAEATEVGDYAFYNTSLTDYDLSSVNCIGDYAFYGTDISEFNENSVTSVGEYAFASCLSLSDIGLNNVEHLPVSALYGSTGITRILLESVSELPVTEAGVSYVSDKPLLVTFNCYSVNEIPNDYFANNSNLVNIAMENVKIIGERAFKDVPLNGEVEYGCVEIVGDYAFYDSEIEDISCETLVEIGDYAFYGTSLSAAYLDCATEIGDYAFANCQYLTTFLVYNENPETDNVKLGVGVCENDTALVNVALYDIDIELPAYFFKNCSKLSKLYATDEWRNSQTTNLADLKSLGKESLYGCTSMAFSKIKLSDIEYIGENACVGILSKLNGDDVVLSNLKYVDAGGFGNWNCRSLALENAEVIKDLPECEYVVIGSDIKDFSCENTETIICAYENSVVEVFCKSNGLNFKKYNSTDAIYLDVDPVLTGYDYWLNFEAIGFNPTYEWYACNNSDRSDAVLIETTFADPKKIDPIKLFVEDYEENKYTYFFCVATSTENGNVLKIQSQLCKNIFATIKGVDDTFIDFIDEVIFTDSLDNINTLDNIITVDGDINVTPSYSTVDMNCYGTGSVVDILNGEVVVMSETIIVLGDINGDAVIDVLDVAEIEKASNENFNAITSYERELAADVNRDEFIDEYDYQAVVNKALA